MAEHLVAAIAARYSLGRRGDRWVGPCPECGGGSKSDRFNIRDDGGFKCYACDFKGDIITWLRKFDNLNCPQAHEAAGLTCAKHDCPVWSSCRLGEGQGKRRSFRPRPVLPIARKKQVLPTAAGTDPEQLWCRWATGFIENAEKRLQQHPEQLAWLAGRGIDSSAAKRFRLGWNDKNAKVNRSLIGLPPRADDKKHLWVPDGLVIPIFTGDEMIHRIRIRRPAAARESFLAELKYVWLQGSGSAPLVIRPTTGGSRGAVIVEAELDAMAVAAAHHQVTSVALGTVRGGLPYKLRTELAELPVILVALDADPGSGENGGAGPAAIGTWLHEYRQARFWPVPQGKDPGEYAMQSGELQAWIEAGLVPEVCRNPAPLHDKILSPECNQQGRAGQEDNSFDDAEYESGVVVTLKNGRRFHVVKDQASWLSLVARGEPVFSENELKRFGLATAGLDEAARAAAVDTLLDVKSVFGQAYVRGGRTKERGSS